MTTIFKTQIRTHEIGLRMRRGELVKVLTPGLHRKSFGSEDLVYSKLDVQFEHRLLEVLVHDVALREHLEVIELSDDERGLVHRAGRLLYLLKPGLYAFWKQSTPLEIERHSIDEVRFEHKNLERILASPAAREFLQAVRTGEHEKIVIYKDGEPLTLFGPGTFAYWVGSANISWKGVALREQVLDVMGQEIMTSDKVTLRVNMVVSFRVVDPMLSVSTAENASQVLYREAQLALRHAIGGRSLDALLSDKETVAAEVSTAIEARAKALGLEVTSAGMRDVILPGEMKLILNQVIEAQKQSEANLIRRREETAAARSQVNTARLMAENPVLMRMKELEQLGQILSATKATIVLGQGDLTGQIRQMISSPEEL